MATTIKIKRSGTASGAPASLKSGELAYTYTNGVDTLYFGKGDDGSGNATSIIAIGGAYYTNLLSATPGTLTAGTAIIVDLNSQINLINVGNITITGSSNTISSTNSNGNIYVVPNGTGQISFYNAYTFPTTLGSAGYALVSNGAGGLTWAGVSSATTATNIAGGTANQIPYQTAPGTTSFFGPGTAGQILVSNGTTAGGPVFTNTSSIYVQDANVSTNIRGGSQGQINYQTAPNVTGFINSGTTGQFLQATTNGAPAWTNTGSMYVYGATLADTATTATSAATAYSLATTGTTYVYRATLADTATTATSAATAYSLANTSTTYVGHAALADATQASVTFNTSNSGAASGSSFNGSNALTVSANTVGALSLSAGGTVSGAVTFGGPVTFNGTATYSLSTNTYFTDNILEIHLPPGGIGTQWTVDDGKDIGLRMHYYNRTLSTDSNAALVLADDSQFLEWYVTGSENAQGVFTGTVTYGVFKTGSIVLGNNQIIGSFANSTATVTGEKLTVYGGGYFTGTVTATNISVSGATSLSGLTVTGYASLSGGATLSAATVTNNLTVSGSETVTGYLSANGGATLSAATVTNALGVTGFASLSGGATLSAATVTNNLNVSGITNHNNNTSVYSTNSGALQVVNGGIGVGGGIYVGGISTFTGVVVHNNSTGVSSTNSGALQIVNGGIGVGGGGYFGGNVTATNFVGSLIGTASSANNLTGGTAGSVPYQSSAGATIYVPIGNPGQVLILSTSTTLPVWSDIDGGTY